MLIKDNDNATQYAVIVEGKVIYKATQIAAELHRDRLPEDIKAKATVVPVTSDNKQILFD